MHNSIDPLLRFTVGQRWMVFLGVLASVLSALCFALPWLFLAMIIDDLVLADESTYSNHLLLLVLIAVAIIGRVIFAAIGSALSHMAAYDILLKLRHGLLQSLIKTPLSQVEQVGRGRISHIVLQDVEKMELFLAHHLSDLLVALVLPIGLVFFLLTQHLILTLAIIAPPIAGLFLLHSMVDGQKNKGFAASFKKAQEQMNADIAEFISGLPIIRIFQGRLDDEIALNKSIDKGHDIEVKWYLSSLKPFYLYRASLSLSLFIAIGGGGWFFLQGSLSLSSWVLFFCLAPLITAPIERIIRYLMPMIEVKSSARRIAEILSWQQNQDCEDETRLFAPAPLTLQGLSLNKDGHNILYDVSGLFPAQGLSLIVGKTGSGKSSLLKLLAKLESPDRGSFHLGDLELGPVSDTAWYDYMTLAFQDTFLKHASIRDNLRLANPDASDQELEKACFIAACNHFIQALPQGMDTLVGDGGLPLSGGQCQRLALARSLVRDPDLLVMDEALSHVDLQLQDTILNRLISQRTHKTTIMVTHQLAIAPLAKTILVMDQGRVIDQGSHEELLQTCSLYQDLWRDPATRCFKLHKAKTSIHQPKMPERQEIA